MVSGKVNLDVLSVGQDIHIFTVHKLKAHKIQCLLEKLKEKGIRVPSKQSLIDQGILYSDNTIIPNVITID